MDIPELDGVPGVLVMIHAAVIVGCPVGPVNRLVQMPEPGRVHAGVRSRQNDRSEKEKLNCKNDD